jgi:7-carboxy-7-deazaguanine synthase
LPIVETFKSIQGEGPHLGIPFYFIRTAGCNVCCKCCDSTYTWNVKDEQFVECDLIISRMLLSKCDWISITGGEPLLYPEQISYLIKNINKAGLHSHLETSGKIYDRRCFTDSEIVSVDIKTPCTGVADEKDFEILGHLRHNDYVKCLVKDEEDLLYVRKAFKVLNTRCELIIQVFNETNCFRSFNLISYMSRYRWLVNKILSDKADWYNVRVLPQVHLMLWSGQRGR